ncbi:MAG: hypothetical protein H7259_00435 [Cytophagales bacterium]|nr:hypothetical protein [Cytophaga sp.]
MNLSIRCLKTLNRYYIFLMCTLFITCKESQLPYNKHESEPSALKQGVRGKVIYKEGTFDSRGNLISNGTVIGVQRDLYFYERSGLKEAETNDGSFLTMIHSSVIDSCKSDKNGNFLIALKPGSYSVIIQENDRLYAQLNDDGYFNPVTVYKDSVSSMYLFIDYKAEYSE